MPQQILANYLRIIWIAFQLLQSFLRLSGFPDFFGKMLLVSFKFSLLGFSTVFRESNINKISILTMISFITKEILMIIALHNGIV